MCCGLARDHGLLRHDEPSRGPSEQHVADISLAASVLDPEAVCDVACIDQSRLLGLLQAGAVAATDTSSG